MSSIRQAMSERMQKKGTRESSMSYPGTDTFIPIMPPMTPGGIIIIVTIVRASMILFSLSFVALS